jgi:hypothetical protein
VRRRGSAEHSLDLQTAATYSSGVGLSIFSTDDVFVDVRLARGPVDDQPNVDIFENVPSETFHPLLS